MTLGAGARLGPYEILSAIGAGGMGEVYLASDTNLKRQVAIKILPESFATDPGRLARFQREAEVLAALNCPNIAQIYGLEKTAHTVALVMELVDGQTLAERIAGAAGGPDGPPLRTDGVRSRRGGSLDPPAPSDPPIPIDEVLSIARQIAAALETAHEQGIVHRDLKPANIKIRSDGMVKVLDFGLAKLNEPASALRASVGQAPSMSPTITSPPLRQGYGGQAVTEAGMIIGTAAYMAPEQASGKAADRRADIWSFGVVLWEMLTGRRLFDGETIAHTLADVLRAPIDLTALPASTPRVIRELVKRCLDRDVTTRLRDIGEARIAIQNYLANPASDRGVTTVAPSVRSTSKAAWAVAALALVALGLVAWRDRGPVAELPSLRLSVPLPDNIAPSFLALSPDGRRLVMKQPAGALLVRSLDTGETRALKDTGTARTPFWSPDSRTIAFFQDGALKTVPATGGPVQTLCEETGIGGGGTWNGDGVILYAADTGALRRVSAAGGACTEVMPAMPDAPQAIPRFLPDDDHFLYVRSSASGAALFLGSLAVPDGRRLLPDRSSAEFLPDTPGSTRGHVLFVRDGTLMAQTFDLGSLELSGDPVAVAGQVGFTISPPQIAASSNNGMVVYLANGQPNRRLVWYDRTGKVLGPVADTGTNGGAVSVSPDGKRAAFLRMTVQDAPEARLMDFERGQDLRLFVPPLAPSVVWSPDADRFVFRGTVGSIPGLHVGHVGGGNDEVLLREDDKPRSPSDWSRDGKWIVYTEVDARTQSDIWLVPATPARTADPIPLVRTPAEESHGQISPDGRWLAYTSNESGSNQVYLEPFAGSSAAPATTWPVSSTGGLEPRWRADGKELFYWVSAAGTRRATLMAVPIGAGANPVGTPVPLFEFQTTPSIPRNNYFSYSPSADGQRFLVNVFIGQAQPSIDVLLNWPASLRK